MVNINSAIQEMNIIPVVDDKSRKKIIDNLRCRVAGSDVSAAGAASLHQATEVWMLQSPLYTAGPRPPRVAPTPPCIADVVPVTSAGVARSTPWA